MKRILVMVMTMMMMASSAYASFADALGDLFDHKQDAARVGNVWYDRDFDFSTIDSIAVYPMDVALKEMFYAQYPALREVVTPDAEKSMAWDRSEWCKTSLFASTDSYEISKNAQSSLKRRLIEAFQNKVKPIFLVVPQARGSIPRASRKGSSDAYAAYRNPMGMMGSISPEEAEELISKKNLYKVEYPVLLEDFDSESERGAAVREATGAQAYLRWRMEGPYTLQEISCYTPRSGFVLGMPRGIETRTASLYTSCSCTLYDGNGREILAYSAKAPIEYQVSSYNVSYGQGRNENKFVEGLVGNLKSLMTKKSASEAIIGAKTVRVGEVSLSYVEGEETYPAETAITKQALETVILERVDASKTLRAAGGATSDYIVEADVTDCTVKMESGTKKMGESIDTSFRAKLKATVRLVNAKTGAVVMTVQDEVSGRSESVTFGKIVKKFFGEVEKVVK